MSREACPFETPDCKYFNGPAGCFSDEHHLQFPRANYRSRVEKDFRELPENKVQLCRTAHDEEHATTEPPLKPSVEVMRHAINESRINRLVEAQNGALHG